MSCVCFNFYIFQQLKQTKPPIHIVGIKNEKTQTISKIKIIFFNLPNKTIDSYTYCLEAGLLLLQYLNCLQ